MMNSHRIRRLAYRSRMAAGPLLPARLPRQKLVFTITNGRSGSARLTALFQMVESVAATHEPEPRFDTLMHEAHLDPALAGRFLRYVKLPAIARLEKPVYVETSHMFGKGYFDAMLELGLPFSLVLLHRDPRRVALSMLRLDTIPGRTHWGKRFYLDPSEALFVKLPSPSRLTDYQLCYWHVRETMARQETYGAMARAAGLAVAEADTDALNGSGAFDALLAALSIVPTADDLTRIEAARTARVNEKRHDAPAMPAYSGDIEAEEAAILELAGSTIRPASPLAVNDETLLSFHAAG